LPTTPWATSSVTPRFRYLDSDKHFSRVYSFVCCADGHVGEVLG
jgi:hypothetical protein